ncbi:hypothetical protein Lesp02_45930 [Lentzea sp. NBRC 105346]|uniref:ABA4-like family protein n=1 Tax=Lentzea sp. NBRC 105346 TaxID=3032205 RepID=UPI0024A40F46|nr:ABA4-like family protein [Lentzea sp. NBRC 105346]GLZ32405.1 hypothetical protein Lesp02_45930 [Lentzea sp. NBRC 105346]
MNTLFSLTFVGVAPVWALMIFAPKWRYTERIAASPWVPAVPVAIYIALAVPRLGELLPLVTRPELPALAEFMSTPAGATLVWAHMIAWDVFVGQWMYREGRRLDINPLLMAPVLVVTILLAPFGLPLFLILRKVCDATNRGTPVVTGQ